MLFNENEFEKTTNKIEIEMSFIYSKYNEDVKYIFNIYYDCGNGLQYTKMDEETYKFASKICKGQIDRYKKYFKPLYDNPFLSTSNNSNYSNINLISDENVRKDLAHELTSFASKMYVPVFLHTNDNYYLLNADKYNELDEYEPLDKYLEKEYKSEEFEDAKKEREKQKFLSRLSK